MSVGGRWNRGWWLGLGSWGEGGGGQCILGLGVWRWVGWRGGGVADGSGVAVLAVVSGVGLAPES